jgi:hypothetical protein
MISNRYSDLSKLSPESERQPQELPPTEVAVSGITNGKPGSQVPSSHQVSTPSPTLPPQPAGVHLIASNEHTAPILGLVTYTINIESDDLVRIYDGIKVLRDDVLLVQRKELFGKSPEEIQAHFSLSFVPRFICDARVPAGHQITMGKLTNAADKRMSIFKALTALDLSSERFLTPENLPPVRVKVHPPTSKPVLPRQPDLPRPFTDFSDGFNISNAELYLRQFSSNDVSAAPIPDNLKITGPDGFPYMAANMLGEAGKREERRSLTAENPLIGNLVQSLLNEGCGLALWRPGEKEPTWVYKYRDILSLKVFNSLRPLPEFDETLYGDTLDKPLPAGSRMVTARPSGEIFPAYARQVLMQRIAATSNNVQIDPLLVEYPEVDTLRRFKLNVSPHDLDAATRNDVGRQANWCLPYVIYF